MNISYWRWLINSTVGCLRINAAGEAIVLSHENLAFGRRWLPRFGSHWRLWSRCRLRAIDELAPLTENWYPWRCVAGPPTKFSIHTCPRFEKQTYFVSTSSLVWNRTLYINSYGIGVIDNVSTETHRQGRVNEIVHASKRQLVDSKRCPLDWESDSLTIVQQRCAYVLNNNNRFWQVATASLKSPEVLTATADSKHTDSCGPNFTVSASILIGRVLSTSFQLVILRYLMVLDTAGDLSLCNYELKGTPD